MTKSEAKAKMVEWIEQKRHETDLLKDLLNQQYILGMLDLAQGLGIINQDERMELLDMAEDGQEEDHTQEPAPAEDIQPEETQEDSEAPEEPDDSEEPYSCVIYAYKDNRPFATKKVNNLDEAKQFRAFYFDDKQCDRVEIYTNKGGHGFRLLHD